MAFPLFRGGRMPFFSPQTSAIPGGMYFLNYFSSLS